MVEFGKTTFQHFFTHAMQALDYEKITVSIQPTMTFKNPNSFGTRRYNKLVIKCSYIKESRLLL